MRRGGARFLVRAALIAAAYAVLTYLSAAMNLAYGPVQFRVSEALNTLALLTPAAVPGLTVGCLLSNIASPSGALDVVLGTAATLLSSLAIRCIASRAGRGAPYLAAVFPTVLNSLAVGAMTAVFLPRGARLAGFLAALWQVGLSEAAVCLALGVPVYYLFAKRFPGLLR